MNVLLAPVSGITMLKDAPTVYFLVNDVDWEQGGGAREPCLSAFPPG